MAAKDKRSNGRWRFLIKNRRAPTLSKIFTRKADALKQANNKKKLHSILLLNKFNTNKILIIIYIIKLIVI